MKLPTAIFREYDIRGTVDDQLTAEVGRAIGQAVATLGWERLGRAPRLAVGRDNRPSGPALTHGLLSGIEAVGGHGVEVGELPTPALYFATHVLNVDGGVQVTGSHNPPEFNGFKVVLGGEAVAGPDIQGLRRLIEEGRTPGRPGGGRSEDGSVLPRYRDAIVQRNGPLPRKVKAVVDCGNGGSGRIAVETLERLGAEALEGVHRDEARDAIAAIHDDLDLARERAVALHDGIAIARQHRAVLTPPAPGTTGGASLFDEASKALDVGAGNRFATEHDLEAVELRRIVRAGHLDAAVHVEHVGREVERRRRQLAHLHAVAAHGLDAGEQAGRERGSGGAVVPPHGQPGCAPQALPPERRDRLPDGAPDLRRELVAHGAADVVLTKNGCRELHGGLPASATGRRRRGGGDRRHGAQPVAARFREVEQAVRANAEYEQAGDRHRHPGATQPTDAHARVGLLERLGLHVHRHNHREIVACRDHARKDENRGQRELPRRRGGGGDVPLAREPPRPRGTERGQHARGDGER